MGPRPTVCTADALCASDCRPLCSSSLKGMTWNPPQVPSGKCQDVNEKLLWGAMMRPATQLQLEGGPQVFWAAVLSISQRTS